MECNVNYTGLNLKPTSKRFMCLEMHVEVRKMHAWKFACACASKRIHVHVLGNACERG